MLALILLIWATVDSSSFALPVRATVAASKLLQVRVGATSAGPSYHSLAAISQVNHHLKASPYWPPTSSSSSSPGYRRSVRTSLRLSNQPESEPLKPFRIPDISEFLGDAEDQYFTTPSIGNDFYAEDMLDDEILADMRKERKMDNDRWQTCNFRESQCGKWTGKYELFYPSFDAQRGLAMDRIASGECTSAFTPTDWAPFGVNISIAETFDQRSPNPIPAPLQRLIFDQWHRALTPTDFRNTLGNQNVGGAFTLCKVNDDASEFVSELGIRDGQIRIRVRYAYTTHSRCRSLLPTEIQSGAYDLSLVAVLVIREALSTIDNDSEINRLYSSELGRGIYDPQIAGEPYAAVDLPGRLSLQFPRGLAVHRGFRGPQDTTSTMAEDGASWEPSVLTMELVGQTMRLQADRRALAAGTAFSEGMGLCNIQSLELTEVRLEDAERYIPVTPKK